VLGRRTRAASSDMCLGILVEYHTWPLTLPLKRGASPLCPTPSQGLVLAPRDMPAGPPRWLHLAPPLERSLYPSPSGGPQAWPSWGTNNDRGVA
jgi:hypothetical protein